VLQAPYRNVKILQIYPPLSGIDKAEEILSIVNWIGAFKMPTDAGFAVGYPRTPQIEYASDH